MLRLSETACPGARYRIGAYRFWQRHLAILTGADFLAHALLGAVDADLIQALRTDGYDWDRVRAGLHDLTTRVMGDP